MSPFKEYRQLGATAFEVMTETGEDGIVRVRFDNGALMTVESAWRRPVPIWSGRIDGVSLAMEMLALGEDWALRHAGFTVRGRVWSPHAWALMTRMPQDAAVEDAAILRAPMPGLLLRLLVAPEEAVTADQPVAVMGAMKMETVLRSPAAGVVQAVLAAAGTTLALDQPILRIG